MVLDVLLQAQEESLDDLSFRYGCRARNCGVCTIDIMESQDWLVREKTEI